MDKENLKQILVSILIGAFTAFLTSLLEGILTFLQGAGNNLVVGMVSGATFARSWRTNRTG